MKYTERVMGCTFQKGKIPLEEEVRGLLQKGLEN